MGILKTLIGLPIFLIIIAFAFINNDLATFNLWPFSFEITVSLSVAILFFVFLGFFLGSISTWMSYAPLRKDLRKQKKKNKKLSKQQQVLEETVSDLQGNLEQVKSEREALKPEKTGFWSSFTKKKTTAETADNHAEGGKNE
jgi:uncharacterized membrane protein YciS (DUF1049 family)